MHKLFLFLLVTVGIGFSSCKPSVDYPKADEGITWITIDQAATIQNVEQKRYLVDVYTNWCGWCKKMDKTTFQDPALTAYLDEKYHVVKFNAEQLNPVVWEGDEYVYEAGGRKGVNTLAKKLLNGRLSYPSFAVLDENRKPLNVIIGYKTAEQFQAALDNI